MTEDDHTKDAASSSIEDEHLQQQTNLVELQQPEVQEEASSTTVSAKKEAEMIHEERKELPTIEVNRMMTLPKDNDDNRRHEHDGDDDDDANVENHEHKVMREQVNEMMTTMAFSSSHVIPQQEGNDNGDNEETIELEIEVEEEHRQRPRSSSSSSSSSDSDDDEKSVDYRANGRSVATEAAAAARKKRKEREESMYVPPEVLTFENCPEMRPPRQMTTTETMNGDYRIVDLDSDTTSLVLSYLDRRNVLSLAETNRYFYHRTSDNALWSNLLTQNEKSRVKGMWLASKKLTKTYKNTAMTMHRHDNPELGPIEINHVDHTGSIPYIKAQVKQLLHLEPLYTRIENVPTCAKDRYHSRSTSVFDPAIMKDTNIKQLYAEATHRMKSHVNYYRFDNYTTQAEVPGDEPITEYWYFFLAIGIIWVLALLYFGIFLPLTVDRYIPRHDHIWLVPFMPPATVICLLYGVFFAFLMKKYNYVPIFTRRKLDEADKCNYTLLFASLLIPIPVTILMYGLKLGLYFSAPNFLWSYMMIPIVASLWITLVNGASLHVIRWDHQRYYLTILGFILMYVLLTAGIVLNALKADGFLPRAFLYSYVFFLYYAALVMFAITMAATIIMKIDLHIRWIVYGGFCTMLCFAIGLAPIYSTLILGGLRLDRVITMPYIAVFAPLYGGIVVLAALVMLVAVGIYGFLQCLQCLGISEDD